ncbi:sigma 54 modulation/S30EA ribosomal C-terminal domain-containing protein [Kitasatospora sp. NPDC094028]
MTRLRHRPAPDVRVEIRGELPREDAEYARAAALDTAAVLGADTRGLRLRVTWLRAHAGPGPVAGSVTRPALAQADVDLAGTGPVRVQLATRTVRESVDLVLGTLAGRAVRLREQGDIGFAARHESAYRPQYAERPLPERRIARHKTVRPARRTPDQAARELLALDRDFHLFQDAATGRPAVVHRCPPNGEVRLWTPDGADPAGPPHLAGPLDPAEAARRLWFGSRPFVCHTDPDDGRARVLYRRYDGHYGLITPVADGARGAGITSAPH